MFTLIFWKATAERAVKSFAQALAAVLAGGTTLWEVSWAEALAVAGMTALLSVLTSVASVPVGSHSSPSLVEQPQPAAGAAVPSQRVPETGAVVAA